MNNAAFEILASNVVLGSNRFEDTIKSIMLVWSVVAGLIL